MKLQTLLSLALLGSTMAFRTTETRKGATRRLEETCTTHPEVAHPVYEMNVTIEMYPTSVAAHFAISMDDPTFGGRTETTGWCIDWDRLTDTGWYMYDAYSAYDTKNIPKDAVDKPQYFPNLAWLINNIYIGQEIANVYVDEQYPDCTGKVNWLEIQGGMWGMIDDINGTGTEYEEFRSECVARWVRDQAIKYGDNYEIDCQDPEEQVPIVLVDDKGKNGQIETQVIISEMYVKNIPGYCDCGTAPTPPSSERSAPSIPTTKCGLPPLIFDSEYTTQTSGTTYQVHEYSGANPNCQDLGFAYGYKIDNKCHETNGDHPFATEDSSIAYSKTTGDCAAGTAPPGTFSVACEAGKSGSSDLTDARMTFSEHTYVIMKGGNGGTVYSVPAKTEVLLDIGKTQKAISHIEFCFVCDACATPTPPAPAPTPAEPAPTPAEPAPTPAEPAPTPAEPAPTPAEPAPTPAEPAPTPAEPAPTPAEPKSAPTAPAPTKGSGSGDPHFKTWTGEKFDYHGECDLVLLDNPTFNNGQGLKIHIRTTRVKYFSYIQKIAVQIGDDVLEFSNDAENFLINGEAPEANKKHHKTHLGGFIVRRDKRALSIRLHDEGRHSHNVAKIDLHTRKNGFPAVIVDGGDSDMLEGSLGLLGDWETGSRVGRDGKTAIDDHTAFAEEWQVRDNEPLLFTDARAPQYPAKCLRPQAHLSNRLGTDSMRKEAEKACAHWKEDKDDCIFDVIATRDVLVAAEGHIVHLN